MAQPITDLLTKAIKTNTIPKNAEDARAWFRSKAQQLRSADPATLLSNSKIQTSNKVEIGQMYLFNYDPKLKDELPYYDRYPLIFPIKPAEGGFLGINLHYLPPVYRGKLMDALYTTAVTESDNVKSLNISYDILNSASRFAFFKPCVKHYLNNHVRSRLAKIDPVDWDVAVFLPLQRFEKATIGKVYKDSRKIISKG